MSEFDAAEIARDIGELYEPLAEEKGISSEGRSRHARAGATAIASWSARRSPIWSTTPSNMRNRDGDAVNGVRRRSSCARSAKATASC